MSETKFDLEKYEDKRVKIVSKSDKVYIGTVDLYTQPNDNDGQEAIAIDTGWWFDECDIKSIEVIE